MFFNCIAALASNYIKILKKRNGHLLRIVFTCHKAEKPLQGANLLLMTYFLVPSTSLVLILSSPEG